MIGLGLPGIILACLSVFGPVGPGLSEQLPPCTSKVHEYHFVATIRDFATGQHIPYAEVMIVPVEREQYSCSGPTPTPFEPISLTSDKDGQIQWELSAVDEQNIGISVTARGYEPYSDTLGSAANLAMNGQFRIWLTKSDVVE